MIFLKATGIGGTVHDGQPVPAHTRSSARGGRSCTCQAAKRQVVASFYTVDSEQQAGAGPQSRQLQAGIPA